MSTKKSSESKTDDVLAGSATGTAAGAVTGGVIGAVIGGPPGAAIGAAAGAWTGAATGGAIGYEAHEAEFQKEYEAGTGTTKGSAAWTEVSPAYRYGFENYDRPEYQGKSYAQVSADLKKRWTGGGTYASYEPYVKNAWERRARYQVESGGETVVPVVEEELQVGKRTVEKGGVKVKTTVTETPVETDVHLHEEHVTVKRRPVDRAVTVGDAAFTEGTITLKETAEEAVVAKKARVVEEVVLSKEGTDKKHTVRDKVRKTDVDVQEVDTPATVTHEAYETHHPAFETHHKTNYADTGITLEEFTPAYRYGHTLATDDRYRTGTWAKVEPEARKHWEAKNEGTWEEFKDAVHHAWDKVRGKA